MPELVDTEEDDSDDEDDDFGGSEGSYKQELVLRVFNRKLLGRKDILSMGAVQQVYTMEALWIMGVREHKIYREGMFVLLLLHK